MNETEQSQGKRETRARNHTRKKNRGECLSREKNKRSEKVIGEKMRKITKGKLEAMGKATKGKTNRDFLTT